MSRLNNSPKLFQGRLVLSDAQIKIWNTVAYVIAPAPGEGLAIICPATLGASGSFTAYLKWYANYTNIGAAVGYAISIDDGNGPQTEWDSRGSLAAGASTIFSPDDNGVNNLYHSIGSMKVSAYVNKSLTVILVNGLGAPTGGDPRNILTLTVPYYIFNVNSGLYLSE